MPGVPLVAGIVFLSALLQEPVSAQTPAPLPSRAIAAGLPAVATVDPGAVDDRALEQWIRDYRAWQEWAARWINRRQWVMHPFPYPFWKDSPDVFSYVAPRRPEPVPPAGLEVECARWSGSSTERSPRAEACALLADWRDDYATQWLRGTVASASTSQDEPSKTRFIEHLHFASLWTNLDVGGARAYGLAGVHATIDVRGRWQIYALPGVLAVSVPNLQGRRSVTIGYDWGMAVRLFNARVPYVGIPLKVHLNLVQVWMPEAHQKIAMAGLSFSANRSR